MKTLPGKIFLVVFSSTMVLATQSCNVEKDRTAEIRKLDSLEKVLADADLWLHRINVDTSDARIDTIEAQLQYLQSNFVGKMTVPMALTLDNYSSLKKTIEAANLSIVDFERECNVSVSQIKDLRQALSENATHDAQQNPITDLYVKQRMDNEVYRAEELNRRMELAGEKYDLLAWDYQEKYLQVKHWVDSIPQKKLKK